MVILFLGWQGSRTRLPYHWALPDRTPSLVWVWKLARSAMPTMRALFMMGFLDGGG